MAVSQSLTLTQVSQSQTSNSSVVRILWKSTQTGDSWNGYTRTAKYYVSRNGGAEEEFSVSYTLPKGTTKTILDTTITVKHTSTGAGSVKVRTWMDTNISAGVVTQSKTLTLEPIALKSTVEASNGTLGTAQELTVTRQNSSFTHTITYKCGTVSGTICTKSGSTSIDWTPPLSLASQNKTGTSVSVTFNITTYNGSTSVGSDTKTISCAIPVSVKPSCTVALADVTGIDATYGSPVQGLSKLKITVTAQTAYGSDIAAYSVDANGAKYTTETATTGALAESGKFKVVATVKDKRGRSGSATATLDVLPYSSPKVSALSVHRCDADGAENDQGEYVRVVFSASVSDLSGLNQARYTLKYKASTTSTYTTVEFSDLNHIYTVTDRAYILPADSNVSYDIEVTAADNHGTYSRATSASTAFTLMNWHTAGNGVGIGKVSEKKNTLEVALDGSFQGPVYGKVYGLSTLPSIPNGADLNDYLTPGCYAVQAVATAKTVANMPAESAGRLFVSIANGSTESENGLWVYLEQRFVPISYGSEAADKPAYVRHISRDGSETWKYRPWINEALKAYPIGSIHLRYDHLDPTDLFGGTWKRITGTFLLGIDSEETIGATGGGTLGEQLGVTGTEFGGIMDKGSGSYSARIVVTEYGNANPDTSYRSLAKMGVNTLPPYIQISIWRRTA
jgi:hypothetical protein